MPSSSPDPKGDPNSDESQPAERQAAHPEFIEELADEFSAPYRAALEESTHEVAEMLEAEGDHESSKRLGEASALEERARQAHYHLTTTDLERLLAILQSPAHQTVLDRAHTVLTMAILHDTLAFDRRLIPHLLSFLRHPQAELREHARDLLNRWGYEEVRDDRSS